MGAVKTTDEFDAWFAALGEAEREEIDAKVGLLNVSAVTQAASRGHAERFGVCEDEGVAGEDGQGGAACCLRV